MGFLSSLINPKPELKPISSAVEGRIKNILGINKLEAIPAHAARAFQIASDPKSIWSDFVEVIESDDALSARVIRIANSVYFQRGEAAKDIESAVANIGLSELRALLSATMLKGLLKSKTDTRKQVWANAIGTAMIAKTLAPLSKDISEGEAFLAGLVHDVGKLIMLGRNDAHYHKVLTLAMSGERPFTEVEEEVFELDHVEVGQWVAERWNFPKSAIEAIAFHHQKWPSSAGTLKNERNIGLLIKVADTLAHASAIGHPSSSSGLKKASYREMGKCAQQFGIKLTQMQHLLAKAIAVYEEQLSMYEDDA